MIELIRVVVPPNSLFVLGPYTNARFTHAVLPMQIIQSRRVSFHRLGGVKEEEYVHLRGVVESACHFEIYVRFWM